MSDPAVDAEDVRHVASLARVDLSEADVDAYADQFADILEYFEALEEVPESDGVTEFDNVLRPDEVRPSLDREAALSNAPGTEEGKFKGPRVS